MNRLLTTLTSLCSAVAAATAHAQPPTPPAADATAWRQCAATSGDAERLACFDRWAGQQAWAAPAASAQEAAPGTAAAAPPPSPVDATLPATRIIEVARTEGCRDPQYSDISRFWELEDGTDCGTFGFHGYRPLSVSAVTANHVNQQPSSPSPGHTAAEPIDYRKTEMRVQLSVRTKLAQGLLTQGGGRKDSLWFGYTQQSYWQLFSPDISRPFRATDHEPEVMYVYPTDAKLPWGWRWRYSGVGLVHQSNGQSDPLSRSWNRAYLMTGLELGNRWQLHARLWQRLPESASSDDNPDITHYLGHGELRAVWNPSQDNQFSATLRGTITQGRGSARLEWLRPLGTGLAGGKSNLRLHTQLFTGYGDSLIDYNRRRTVLSVGLSLVDF
jgi:phospholipase A1